MTNRRSSRITSDWKALRWEVEMPAQVKEHRGCAFDISVVDISRTGCRLWAGFQMTPGRAAKLFAESFAPFDAVVVWAENWHAALHFDQPLHGAVLRHLIDRYPADGHAWAKAGAGLYTALHNQLRAEESLTHGQAIDRARR